MSKDLTFREREQESESYVERNSSRLIYELNAKYGNKKACAPTESFGGSFGGMATESQEWQ